MLGLLIVVTVVGLYLIGNRLQMILTILDSQMPEEQKKKMTIKHVKGIYASSDYMQSEIKRIESTDASSIVYPGMPSGTVLLIYLILGLLAWTAIELGILTQFG